MDHGSGQQAHEATINEGFDPYITEGGKKYMVPYHMIKRVIFENVDKKELIDIPHAARLQYRLMLMDSVIKASVDFTKAKITIIYNHTESDNNKEKISLMELNAFLLKEGIRTNPSYTQIEDYDYYKNFYSYAYNPAKIRERAPYGYTMEQWQKMRPDWEEKMKKGEILKHTKFRNFQEAYLDSNPNASKIIDPERKPIVKALTLKERIFGKNKGGNGKGFWFHGM